MNAVQKLRQLVGEIGQAKSPAQAQSSWELAERLMGRMMSGSAEVSKVFAARDLAGFDALVRRHEEPAIQTRPPDAGAGRAAQGGESAGNVSQADMESALRAFRKRLKLSRLADESKLGGRRLSTGRKSSIDAILPPHEFPREVWHALAVAGKLRDEGQGFYSLP